MLAPCYGESELECQSDRDSARHRALATGHPARGSTSSLSEVGILTPGMIMTLTRMIMMIRVMMIAPPPAGGPPLAGRGAVTPSRLVRGTANGDRQQRRPGPGAAPGNGGPGPAPVLFAYLVVSVEISLVQQSILFCMYGMTIKAC